MPDSPTDAVASIDAPDWFTASISIPAEQGAVDVDGARIAFRAWGDHGLPGVVLVHGGAAHGAWWDHIGPQLAEGRRVVAIDLSGHGDSDWRDTYTLETWAAEVLAVAGAAGARTRPMQVVGHSLGGIIAARTASLHPDVVDDIVVIDSEMFDANELAAARRNHDGSPPIPRTGRIYATRDEALARFRLVPASPSLDYTRSHVAWHSVTQRDDGWDWKFDRTFAASLFEAIPPLPPKTCRAVIVRGGHGRMTEAMARRLHGAVSEDSRIVVLETAGHHIPLDEPLALIDVLRGSLPHV